jgi:hypothetical protein
MATSRLRVPVKLAIEHLLGGDTGFIRLIGVDYTAAELLVEIDGPQVPAAPEVQVIVALESRSSVRFVPVRRKVET